MVDQKASGATGAPADRAESARRVRRAGADATRQTAAGPGTAGPIDRSTGPRPHVHPRSHSSRSGGPGGAAQPAGRRFGSRLGEPAGALWARLTDRDRRILTLVSEHRVLTTEQLTALEFGSTTRAQHRLQELHGLDVLWRFRFPRAAGGSYPWHYALGYTGARLIAAQKAVRPPRPAEHAQHLERLVESPKLRHQLGVNDFFVALAGHARRRGWPQANQPNGTGLVTWWSESQTSSPYASVHPDGYGRWAENGRPLGFYLEYDTGTETQATVARKLNRYVGHYRTPYQDLQGMLLFSLATTRRETGIRAALARSLGSIDGTLDVATTARDYGHPDGPAGPVWVPLVRDPDIVRRVRLPDLPSADAVRQNEPASADAIPMLTEWMDDGPAETVLVDLDADDESWPS
ncbi:MAG TPA: replication-relaxation family protein [Jatrophihabitans sp.]